MNLRALRFLQLGSIESFNKLKLAFNPNSKSHLEIWAQGARKSFFMSDDLKGDVTLKEETVQIHFSLQIMADEFLDSSPKIMELKLGEISYYAIVDVEQNGLVLREGLHRFEQREEQRLLVYPHTHTYVYLKKKKVKSNIIEFNRKQNDVLNNYEIYRYEEIQKKASDFGLSLNTNEELLELRVVDLAIGGLAILASLKESELIDSIDKIECYLNYQNKTFALGPCQIMHKVSFLNPLVEAGNSSWFRLGLSIKEAPLNYQNFIKEKIEDDLQYVKREEFIQYVKRYQN